MNTAQITRATLLQLQHFAEGGTASGAAASAAAQTAAPAQSPTTGAKDTGKAKVVYGKQTADPAAAPKPEAAVTSNTLEARKAEFDNLINGDYKAEFTERTQAIINKRFAETKSLQDKVDASQPLLDMLSQRYGTSDTAKIIDALDKDDAYWEQAAEDAGMTVEQYRYVKKLERQNAEGLKLKQDMQQEADKRRFYETTFKQWSDQADAMKTTYPSFDLEKEISGSPDFAKLLRSGIPVSTAYEVTHLSDIKQGLVQSTARRVESNVVNGIRTRGQRPLENGAVGQPGAVIKDNVHSLTPKDRAEIARRASRGEKIMF